MPLALEWEFSVSRSKDFVPKCFSIFVPVKANKCCYFFFSELLRATALQLVSVVFSQAGSCVETQRHTGKNPTLTLQFLGAKAFATHTVPTRYLQTPDSSLRPERAQAGQDAAPGGLVACLCHFPFAEGQAALTAGSGLLFRIHQGETRDSVSSRAFSGTLNCPVCAVTPVLSFFAFGRGERGDLNGRVHSATF